MPSTDGEYINELLKDVHPLQGVEDVKKAMGNGELSISVDTRYPDYVRLTVYSVEDRDKTVDLFIPRHNAAELAEHLFELSIDNPDDEDIYLS
jgi:hypothetical protein